jgi:hypothetical protein
VSFNPSSSELTQNGISPNKSKESKCRDLVVYPNPDYHQEATGEEQLPSTSGAKMANSLNRTSREGGADG